MRRLNQALVRIWVQIIVLNHKLPAEVDTNYSKSMPLNEVREFFSFCGNVTKYTVENSAGHTVSLFWLFVHAAQWETNQTKRYVVITSIMGDTGLSFLGHEIYSSLFGCATSDFKIDGLISNVWHIFQEIGRDFNICIVMFR